MKLNSEIKKIIDQLKDIKLQKDVSTFYKVGMFISSIIMVLLPIMYFAIIVVMAFIIKWHFIENTTFIDGKFSLLLYLLPGIIGSILVVAMLYPFKFLFIKSEVPDLIKEDDAPELFAIIKALSKSIGNKVPVEIAVDMDVNASASFKPGLANFLQGNLRLTIGLTLIKTLKLDQLIGIIAHEFGHFSQGSGMRLTYIVRTFNHIMARMAYGDEEMDRKLSFYADDDWYVISFTSMIAKMFLWITRKIVYVLFYLGSICSNYMLRQMEFDADWFEINITGSEEFEKASDRLTVASYANQWCLMSITELQLENKVISNIPDYVQKALQLFKADDIETIIKSSKQIKT